MPSLDYAVKLRVELIQVVYEILPALMAVGPVLADNCPFVCIRIFLEYLCCEGPVSGLGCINRLPEIGMGATLVGCHVYSVESNCPILLH